MKENQSSVLVPYDFTEVAEFALLHAINYAKKTNSDITILNIVDKKELLKSYSKKVEETITVSNKLNDVSRKYSKETGVQVSPLVLEGSIFTTIGDVAAKLKTSLIFMGIHEMKGMQKITGSWAMKVISSTNIPFMIVQAPPTNENIDNIVFPLDETKGVKVKLSWINHLNKKYNSKVRIVKLDFTAGSKITSSLIFIKKYFEKNNISYDIFEPHKSKNFNEALLNYSQKIKADIIIIKIKEGINITDYIMGVDEQKIIFNEYKIPVICVTPENEI